MKIRTDFVTNSSSSSFTLTIAIDTVNGNTLSFDLSSGEEEQFGYLTARRSPEEMGQCSSIEELKDMLRMSIKIDDEDELGLDDEGLDAGYEFFEGIDELNSMDEIKAITVSSWFHCRIVTKAKEAYTYYRKKGITVHAVSSGDDEECEDEYDDNEEIGEPAGEIAFDVKGKTVEGEIKSDGFGGSRACLKK